MPTVGRGIHQQFGKKQNDNNQHNQHNQKILRQRQLTLQHGVGGNQNLPHLLGGRPVGQSWILPYTVENYSHEDEIMGMRFTIGPQEIELQVLCIACAAADAPDGRFATVTDADRAAIRGTCWLNICRIANLRDAAERISPQLKEGVRSNT